MPEIILTLFLVGAVTGFIYSMPIAGPISVIVVSKAFQGKIRFCLRTAIGAAISEGFFVFVVVYGITALYELYQPVLPYFLLIGAVFVVIVGLKIVKQKIDLKAIEANKIITNKDENRGGLRAGILINLTNPTLIISWFIASFITLSFVASLGLNIGGLDLMLNQNIQSASEITGSQFNQIDTSAIDARAGTNPGPSKQVSQLFMSLAFAIGVGIGAYSWLHILTRIIVKYREKIKTSILDMIINGLGIVLMGIGVYLGYRAVMAFLG